MRSIDAIRRQNLVFAIEKFSGGVNKNFAARIGKDPVQISRWLKTTNISSTSARELERILGLPENWFDALRPEDQTIKEPAAYSRDVRAVDDNDPSDEHTIYLNKMHFALAAGNGCLAFDGDPDRRYPLPASYFARRDINPDTAKIWDIRGRSMEPRLQDGDSVVVDTARTNPIHDGRIYAVIYAGEGYIKRIIKQPDGGITLYSDNRDLAREDKHVAPEQLEHLRIIGQVMDLVGGRID